MDTSLIYCVAQEYLLVRTPSKEATRAILPNYEPFLVEELPEGKEPLFTFEGGADLTAYPRKVLREDKLSEVLRDRVYQTKN